MMRMVGCIHVSGLFMRLSSLAQMKSADRIPNHLSALYGAWSRWAYSIPGPTGLSSCLSTLAFLRSTTGRSSRQPMIRPLAADNSHCERAMPR